MDSQKFVLKTKDVEDINLQMFEMKKNINSLASGWSDSRSLEQSIWTAKEKNGAVLTYFG